MTTARILQTIIDVLSEIQTISGREVIAMSGSTCPIGQLPGFDSLNGIEVTLELSSRLGYDFEVDNLLVDDVGHRALSIGEVADRIQELLNQPRKAK